MGTENGSNFTCVVWSYGTGCASVELSTPPPPGNHFGNNVFVLVTSSACAVKDPLTS